MWRKTGYFVIGIVLIIGVISLLPMRALAAYTLCVNGPQCHDGMTTCSYEGSGCYCHWFSGVCIKDVPGG